MRNRKLQFDETRGLLKSLIPRNIERVAPDRADTRVLTDCPPLRSTQICFRIPESTIGSVRYFQRQVGKATEPDVLETQGNWAQKKAEVRHLTESRGWVKSYRLIPVRLPSSQKTEIGKCFLRGSEGSQRKDTDFCGISNKKAGLLTGYPRVRLTV